MQAELKRKNPAREILKGMTPRGLQLTLPPRRPKSADLTTGSMWRGLISTQ